MLYIIFSNMLYAASEYGHHEEKKNICAEKYEIRGSQILYV